MFILFVLEMGNSLDEVDLEEFRGFEESRKIWNLFRDNRLQLQNVGYWEWLC